MISRLRSSYRQTTRGFTLVELLVVVAILGLLAAMITPRVMGHLGQAKVKAARMEIKNIAVALDLYRIDVGQYPTQEEGLSALRRQPANAEAWRGPYLGDTDFLDPWESPYVYKIPAQDGDYDLISFGADKIEGGTGENEDIKNTH
jgi:general secretion pathway protein G